MQKQRHELEVMLLCLLCSVGCADKLELRDDDRADEPADAGLDAAEIEPPDGIPRESGNFVNQGREGGGVSTVVDAVSEEEWRYFDLDTGTADEAEDVWDLAFSRFRVRINGGISGPRAVQIATLTGEAFEDLSRAPDTNWSPERADSEGDQGDADSDPDNVFNGAEEDWYLYDVMTHTLSPKDITYVVASTEERFYKLRIVDYYDSAGTGGFMRLDWDEIEAPSEGWPPTENASDAHD
jgi:hypothetical protein